MTQNKFWLVCKSIDFDETLNTEEEAIQKARHACEVNLHSNVYILEGTHHFKANVNVIETDLTAPEESLAVEPKFKVGDKVLTDDGNYGIVISLNPSVPPSANIKLIDSEKVYYYYFTGLTLAE